MANFTPSESKTPICGLCSKSQGQWSASRSLPGPKSLPEAPHSQDTTRWLWRTWKLKSVNLSLILTCSTSIVPKLPTQALCICFYLFLVKCLYLLLSKQFSILLCIFSILCSLLCVLSFVYQVILSFNPPLFFSILFYLYSLFCSF